MLKENKTWKLIKFIKKQDFFIAILSIIMLHSCFFLQVNAASTTTALDFGAVECGGYISENFAACVFGMNYAGRFGNGTEADGYVDEYILTPSWVMSDAKQIVTSSSTSLNFYISNDGNLYGAGVNEECNLGDGTTVRRLYPVKIMEHVVSAGSGRRFSVALTENGDLYGWGKQIQYFCGNESLNYSVPNKIFENVKSFSCSDFILTFITNDDKLYRTSLWEHGFTDLGLGPAPGFHFVADNVKNVSCDDNAIFYVDNAGSLWALGFDEYGKFMYDEEKWHPTVKEPIKIVNSGVEKCLDNGTELFYLTFDGKLFAVGYNGNGIMGLGWQPWDDTWKEKYSSLTYTYPIFEIGTNVIDIAADDFNAGYVTADGKVYISGFGADGSYNKSLYFVERTDIKLAGNCNGTLINQVGPYDISISIGSDKLCCLDKIINLDVPAQLIEERTLVPLRAVFEALDAEVIYDEKSQTILSKRNETEVIMEIGSNIFTKNGEEKTMDVAPQMINERTLIPLRAVAEAFDCTVMWDDITQTVAIKKG